MDTTLYEDCGSNIGGVNRIQATMKLKSAMMLDLANTPPLKVEKLDGVLSSSDVGLPSPELERFLFQQADDIPATSTPTTQILFPKSVTEEQEAYARGFIDALEELHKRQGPPIQAALQPMAPPEYGECDTMNAYSAMASRVVSGAVRGMSYGGATVHHTGNAYDTPNRRPANGSYAWSPSSHQPMHVNPTSSPYPTGISAQIRYSNPNFINDVPQPAGQPKEEPQTVPCLGSTPPLSPINMDDQEHVKLERKRARNRMAARKCRTRKLEQIAHLEMRVRALKDQNSTLAHTAATIREQVGRLRQQITGHVQNGCRLSLQLPTTSSSQFVV